MSTKENFTRKCQLLKKQSLTSSIGHTFAVCPIDKGAASHSSSRKVAVVSGKRTNGGLRLQVRKSDIGGTMEQKKEREKNVPLRG